MIRIVAILLFISAYITTPAQQARQYSFSHFTTADGLSSNFINSIIQDKEGYIWIATVNGLQRYDGNKFLTIKKQLGKAGSLPADNVLVLFKDRKDRIWISCATNAVGIFDTRKLIFTEAPVESRKEMPFYSGKYFFEDLNGDLLLHDYGTLYKYDEGAKRFFPANELIPHPKDWKLSKFIVDAREKKYWMCGDSGIALYDPHTKNLSYRGNNRDRNPIIERVTETNVFAIFMKDNSLLYAAWPPFSGHPFLYRIDKAINLKREFLLSKNIKVGYHEISGFLQQKSGRTWIYGKPLLIEWVDGTQPFLQVPNEYRNEQSIKFDQLFAAYEDKELNVWLATDNGVFLFNPDAQVFTAYNLVRPGTPAQEGPVQAMAEMKDGSFFVGCWGLGIYLFDKHLEPLALPSSLASYQNSSIWDMNVSGQNGELWMSLQPGGVIVYNPETKKSIYHQPLLFNKKTIRQVEEDGDGNMWLGAQDGKLFKWDRKKSGGDPRKGYELVLQTGQVQKLHIDPKGYLWIATLEQGLLQVDTRTHKIVRTITNRDRQGYSLFNNSPTDMTQYDDTTMIVTAGCINVIHTNTGKIDFFGVEQGLPSNTALSVQKDNKGILWVGMLNGLCRLNLVKGITTFFNRRDGIPYDNFSGAGVEKLADGRIVFYTDHNFLVFDPSHFFQTAKPAKPVITTLALGSKSLSLDSLRKEGAIDLRYDNTSLSFEFSSLSFIKQKKYHYYYKLEGVDEDWVYLDNDSRAIYNYLPPGKYFFKVKSENADGLMSEETVSLPIIVTPPAWRTWWFYSLVILILGFGLFIIDRERLKRIRSLQQVRTQIAGNLHQEVETTLGNINVLSEIAKIRAGTNVEQSKDFIDQISKKSRNMMDAMDDVLWSINPENDSMGKTVLRIKEFTEGLRTTNGIDIDLIVDKKVHGMRLNMVLRHELFFFYKEAIRFLINNHSCEQIFVHLTQKGSVFKMEFLSECGDDMEYFKSSFCEATAARVSIIKGVLDITTDRKSMSVVLSVPV
ncbi:MAG: hypothetical protein JWP69_109 [Flaviaesturariibacter sp.]|nr:hypothetical protein [Flaviaesturariibacter sp.]